MGGGEWKSQNLDPNEDLKMARPWLRNHTNPENGGLPQTFLDGKGHPDDVIDLFNRMMDESTDPNFKALLSGITGNFLEDARMRKVMTTGLNQVYKSISEGEFFENKNLGTINESFIQKMAEKMIAVYEEENDIED
jgi:hypothetical protein